MAIEMLPSDNKPKRNIVEVSTVVGWKCSYCGKKTDAPRELGKAGIGWHESAEGGYSCPGVGSRPVEITMVGRYLK